MWDWAKINHIVTQYNPVTHLFLLVRLWIYTVLVKTDTADVLCVTDRHCSVRREAVLLRRSDHRPVAVVCVHWSGRAAVGTGETGTRWFSFWTNSIRVEHEISVRITRINMYWGENEEVDTWGLWQQSAAVTLTLLRCCHHDHRHGNELSTWKHRDSCLRAQRGSKPNMSVPLWIHTRTQTHTCTHDPLNICAQA